MIDRQAIGTPEPEQAFEADPSAFRDAAGMIIAADRDDGLDAALGVVAGVLVAALSFLVDAFGRVEARGIVDKAVERYFARLTQ